MVSDTGSNKRQATPVMPRKSKAQQTVDNLPNIRAFGAGNYGADKRVFGEGYNVGQGLAKAGQMGLTQVAKAGSSAGAWIENLLGDFAREGTNGYWNPDTSKWLFNRWNRAIDAEAEGVQQRYAENTAKGGKAAQWMEDMGAATVAAVPQAVAAILTGGASTAATAEQLAARAAASQGLTGTISRAMQAMGKDPNFRLSFAQVVGPGYEQAKADGADDLRASLYAIGNGLLNAAVEAGGGIQTLPNELKGGTSAWRAWVDSMLDEGKEEVVQGVIERAMQNTVYGKDNPLVGVGKGAVLDPAAAAEEFAGGAVVGGLLGGGQIGAQQLLGRVGRGNGTLSAAQEQRQAAYRGAVPQNIENPRVGRLEMSSAPYNPTGADINTVYGNRHRNQVKENAIRRLGIADGKPAYLAAPNITKGGREYYVDVTKASLNKMLYTGAHEILPVSRLLLVDNLEKAIDGSYWAESNGDRKGRDQIDGFDTLRTSFYIDGIPYYADIKVKVVTQGRGSDPQNVAYFLEPEEITSIKRMDTSSPTGGRPAPNIVFRDDVSISDPSVSQNTQGVNTQDMQNGVKYAQLPRLVDANGMDAQQRTAWLGALAQMPQEQRNQFETAAQIAQRFGATVQARGMREGVQGSYQDGVISIDPSAADPVRQVLIHELTHHMERSGLYGRFSDAALQFVAENMGADVDTLRRAVIADYARAGVTLDEDGATREIVAKFAEEKLFTDEATVRRLLVQDRNLFQRIYDWLRDTVAKLQGTQEQRRLIDAQNLYEKALRQAETGTQGRGAQYSVAMTRDGYAVAVVNDDILSHIDTDTWDNAKKEQAKKAAKEALSAYSSGIPVDGVDYKVNRTSRREYTRSNDTERLYNRERNIFADKMRAASGAEDIITATRDWAVDGGLNHQRKDNFVDFAHGKVLLQAGNNQYEARTVVGITAAGEHVLYDVVDMTPTYFEIERELPTTAAGQQAESDIQGSSLPDSIPAFGGNVNTEKLSAGRSIDEMAGRHLSDEDIAWQENQERAQAARRKAAIDRMAGWTPPPPRRGEGAAVAAEVERRNAQGTPRTVNVPPVDTWGATFDSRAEARRRSYAEAISDLTTQQVSRDAEDMRNGTGSYAYRYYESPENIGVDEGAEAADRIYAEMVRKSGHNPYTGTDIAEELAEASRETMRKKSMGERLAGAVDTLDGLEDAVRADSELRQMRREAREAEGLKMPETLRRIGVEPFGSEADYLGAEDLAQQASENERARRRTKKEAAKIPASEKEKLFARQLAEGTISWDDVPQTVNRSTVDVLADYYRVMDTETESRLLRDRRDLIFQREEAKMPALLGMDVRYDEGGLRENGKPSGKVAQQVSTLRRNLQTPARVCTTEWGREHGKRVYETLFQPVTENNGRQIDWVNSMLDRVRTFKGKDGKARELNRAERDLVQRLVESRAAGDRVQQQGKQYAEAKQNMDAAKGITVEQYLQDKGVLQEEKEQAIRDAYAEYSGKKKRGELKNTTYAAYMAEAVPGYAEYQKAKDEARKELYKKVIVGEITSRSAEARLQEAINGGERAIRYFERLGVDWHKYEEANYSQEAIFRRGTGADSKTQEYRGAAKAWAAAKKNGPFLRAAENVRNGWSAADAAKEFGIDKSQQEYRDLENYAAYLEAKKRAESDTGVDPAVVDEAVKAYSGLYKEMYDGINTFLAAHGYKPIGFIEGYAPHMQPEETKTAFSKALKMLGLDDTAMMLPTSISGITADLKPYKQYDPFFQTRHGNKTEYDIAKGFENYVYYLGNIFYHTDDIMRIRTAAKYIRKTYTSEEASEQISWAENARNFDDANVEEFLRFNGIIKKGTKLEPGDARNILNEYIDGLYEQIGDVSRYSEMVKYLDNYANRLAGKQNMLDRGAEAAAGRRSLNWVNTLSGRYGGAKLAFNVGSALNQTSQLPMVMAENGEMTTARAIRDFFTEGRGDFVKNSSFLKGKKGVDWLLGPETGWAKFKEKGFAMTEAVDSFTSYVAVRSKYLKEKRLGASDAEAMKAADEYGRNVMGSRARGEKPMLFDTKNPFWQIATRFQLEAMNSWEHITRDLPAEYRQMAAEKGKAAATARIGGQAARYVLWAFLINCGIGALSGGSPVPYDILGVTAEAVGAAMGMTGGEAIKTLLDDVLQAVFDQRLFGTDEPEDDEDKDWWAALESFFGNAANDVPILGRAAALAGIGDQTLPTADFSKLGDLADSARNNGVFSTDTLDKAMTAAGEFLYGGNQLRKTVQGTMAAAQGGVYSKGKLRYQVDRSPWNVGRAVLFGRGALDETEEYYARQAKQFSEKQTTAWEKLQETGGPDKTAQEQRQLAKKGYDLIQELRSIEKEDDDDNRAAMQRQALREADVSEDVKAVVWYETMASEKDREAMDALKDADRDEVASVMMDMKDSKKAGEKLRIIMSSRLTDEQKGILYLNTLAGDEDKDKIAVLQDAYMDAYQYLAYKTAISGLSGRFEKLNAINTLELTNYQKDALYYLNGWSAKTHDDVPWVQGVSAEASANRLAAAVAHRESQPEQTPQWQQSLEDYLGIYEQRRQAMIAYHRAKQATSEQGDIYEQRRQAMIAYRRGKKG